MASDDLYEIEWITEGWEDFLFLAKHNKKLAQNVKKLLDSIKQDPFRGIGKPEPLRHSLSGCWSRRVDLTNRLLYRVVDKKVYILSTRTHYGL